MLPLPPLRVWEILSAEEESPSSAAWNYPEVADNFGLRYLNLLHCSLLVV
jgi:hypothetical protein